MAVLANKLPFPPVEPVGDGQQAKRGITAETAAALQYLLLHRPSGLAPLDGKFGG